MGIDKDFFENLKEKLIECGYRGRSSSISHLKSALYDWNVERGWNRENYHILNYEEKGYIFCTFTKKAPQHCTLRHFFVIEAFRGQSVGKKLMNDLYNLMKQNNIKIIRFFSDIQSVDFYKKIGYNKFHGLSKTKLPFYYGDIYGNLLPLPKNQKRYVVNNEAEENINNLF